MPCSPVRHYHKAYEVGAKRREGERKGQITSLLTLVLVQHLSLNIFFPSELVSIKRASLVELLQ